MPDEDPRELQFEELPASPRGIASDIARRADITRRGLIGAGLGVAASAVPTGRAFSAAETETDSNLPPAVPQWQKQPGAPVMTPPYGAAVAARGERRSPAAPGATAADQSRRPQQHPAAGPGRHRHAERAALRAAPRRRACDRSRSAPADHPRPRRPANDLHDGGFGPLSLRLSLPLSRMLRQFVADVDRPEARTHRTGHARAAQLRRMDRRAAGCRPRRGGRSSRSQMDARGRRRRGRDDAQHSDREGARRRPARLSPERRAPAPRAGLSVAPVPAGIRGQHERQMAAAPEARRGAVRDPRGNLEIYDGDAGSHHSPIQFRDGGEIRHHLSLRAAIGSRRPASAKSPVWPGRARARSCASRSRPTTGGVGAKRLCKSRS